MSQTPDSESVVEVQIDGELDLHTYAPKDLGMLLPAYLEACREKGILEVRVVHGKGTGALKRSVHELLLRIPSVREFREDHPLRGGWGATCVKLAPLPRRGHRSVRRPPSAVSGP